MQIVKMGFVSLLLAAPLALGGCLDFEDPFTEEPGDAEEIPDAGNSDIGAPTSVLGQTMVQTVTTNDLDPHTIAVGGTITYSFIDANTILGDGMNVIATESWSYAQTGGDKAELKLEYGAGQGRSKELLTFTSETGGTYRSEISLDADGSFHWHEGTFIIKPVDDGSGGGRDPGECTSTEGQLTIYTTNGTSEDISVYVDGMYAGLLTHYYYGGDKPVCGEPTGVGQLTLTLSAGSHTVSASSASYTWSPDSTQIQACGCMSYQLY